MVGEDMNPGELNCRINLLKPLEKVDAHGGYEAQYATITALWAKITAKTSKSVDQYEQLVPEILHKIIIRYRSDINIDDRFEYKNRIFEQLGPPINEGERKAYLILECREVVKGETET